MNKLERGRERERERERERLTFRHSFCDLALNESIIGPTPTHKISKCFVIEQENKITSNYENIKIV